MNEAKQVTVAVLIMLSFLISMYFYPILPDEVPVHWNSKGKVDNHIHKFWALFLLPIISAVSVVIFYYIPKIDPLKKNIAKFRNHYDVFVVIFTGYMFYVYFLSVVAHFQKDLNFVKLMIPAFSVLIFYTGIFLKSAKKNWFIGIRTPWTMSHNKVWKKTHKLAGLLFKISGVISLGGIFFEKYTMAFILIPVMVSSIFLILYSFYIYEKKVKKKKH